MLCPVLCSRVVAFYLFIFFINLFVCTWTQFFKMPFADLNALTRCSCRVDRRQKLTVPTFRDNAEQWHFAPHAGTVRYGGTPDSLTSRKRPNLRSSSPPSLTRTLLLVVSIRMCVSVAHPPPLCTTSPRSITPPQSYLVSFFFFSSSLGLLLRCAF